ncbi:MAG: Hpt domain-containing protein [Asticcacaulis sp.]|uniref:Hpt domain-containing protein n=1 Tax=Asticcacaulis sp. TaxID=1872648 RepID=UPI0039E66E41
MNTAEILDMAAVSEARAMFKAKFPTMCGYYLEDAEGYVNAIGSAIASGDVTAIVSPAHTLKSSSRQMGAALVSGIAKEIEAAAREATNGMPWFSEQLARLEEAFSQTRVAFPTE